MRNTQILGWVGYVRVDGTVYSFLGDPSVAGSQKAIQKSLDVGYFRSFDDHRVLNLLLVDLHAKRLRIDCWSSGLDCVLLVSSGGACAPRSGDGSSQYCV